MTKKIIARIGSILGTILVLFTVLSPLLFGLAGLGRFRKFHFDYLMPAEFGFFAVVGGILLFVSAILARRRIGIIAGGLGAAVVCFAAMNILAVVTGLADGAAEPTGWRWALVIGALAFYTAGLAAAGIGGILLIKDLFKKG